MFSKEYRIFDKSFTKETEQGYHQNDPVLEKV
jgi:hypothetical protein